MLSAEAIQAVAPKCPTEWATALVKCMADANITTPPRIAMFIAQCAHESAGFTRFEENLNYSANGLMATWPKRFPNLSIALLYARDPEKIANRVYGNRLGNGDEKSGHGWLYRGRGAIQITGRENYKAAGDAIRYPLLSMPHEAAQPPVGAAVGAWFWRSRGLNAIADENTADSFLRITKKINGGTRGLADRERWLSIAQSVFT